MGGGVALQQEIITNGLESRESGKNRATLGEMALGKARDDKNVNHKQ